MTPELFLSDRELTIFLFHGVIEKQTHQVRNYTRKHMEKSDFASILKALKSEGTPLSMDDVLEHCEKKKPYPKKAFAITFDDGFENNLTVAAPVLDGLKIPAAFYFSTHLIDENSMSWIDRIEYVLESPHKRSLRFAWAEEAFPLDTAEQRINACKRLRQVVKADPKINSEEVVFDVCRQLGVPAPTAGTDPLDQKLNWQQVSEMNSHPLFIVGGHCHHHLNMAFLKPDELETEVRTSLELLKEKAGVEPTHDAYPEGLENCFSPAVIEALKRHGVRCCPTAIHGTNQPDTDPFHLRRIML